MTEPPNLDLKRLYKQRAAVGRFGEMDAAGWWNTQGVLGSRGAAVYRRGLPRTHFFARVRVVTAVAKERSASVYPAPGIATLWHLPPDLERSLSFEERSWATNGNNGEPWSAFEAAIAAPPADGLVEWLEDLGLFDANLGESLAKLPLAPGDKGVEVPAPITETTLQLLAAAHGRGTSRNLVVPFVEDGLEHPLG